MCRNVLTTVLTIATITTLSSSSYSLDGGTLHITPPQRVAGF